MGSETSTSSPPSSSVPDLSMDHIQKQLDISKSFLTDGRLSTQDIELLRKSIYKITSEIEKLEYAEIAKKKEQVKAGKDIEYANMNLNLSRNAHKELMDPPSLLAEGGGAKRRRSKKLKRFKIKKIKNI